MSHNLGDSMGDASGDAVAVVMVVMRLCSLSLDAIPTTDPFVGVGTVQMGGDMKGTSVEGNRPFESSWHGRKLLRHGKSGR